MTTTQQITFSNAFSWMKNFFEVCSQWSKWQQISIGSGNGSTEQAISHYLYQCWPNSLHGDIYAAPGELTHISLDPGGNNIADDLPHWSRNKMNATLQTTFSDAFLSMKITMIKKIIIDVYYWSPIGNKSVLVHEMEWRRTGDKPWPGPTVNYSYNFIKLYEYLKKKEQASIILGYV